MPGFLPVLSGEAQGLRTHVEGLLCQDPSLINERIDYLDRQLVAEGFYVTFGAEIEFQFLRDPASLVRGGLTDKESLYLAVVNKLQPFDRDRWHKKGRVIMASSTQSPIMLNTFNGKTYNPDTSQSEGDISEIRTAPALGNEAISRYWNTINAIAEVAAENGMLGMIISTDFSTATTYQEKYFLEASHMSTARHIAALQRNLTALRSLQIDAGVATGIAVIEAFPHSKDASITVHPDRRELQHDLIGVIDPTVDVLAALYAAYSNVKQTVPATVVKGIRECHTVTSAGLLHDESSMLDQLLHMGAWDRRADRLVLPTLIDAHTRGPEIEGQLDELVTEVTEGVVTSYLDDEGQVIKAIARSLRCTGDSEIVVDPRSPFAKTLGSLVKGQQLYDIARTHRVLPEIILDSPGLHAERRRNLTRSSVVRSILGHAAVHKLVPADEAIERRKELLDSMVSTGAS